MKRAQFPLPALLLFLALAPAGLPAANWAVMQTGQRIRIDRHEAAGAGMRLYLPGGGAVDVAANSIRGFEADEYTPPPPAAPSPAAPAAGDVVQAASQRHGLDVDLVRSVIRAESGGNPRAVSPKGARGLMQLMPQTARDLNVSDVFDPQQNVEGGVRYLRQLLEQHGNDLALALAAYNAGPGKVAAYRGIPPYRETR